MIDLCKIFSRIRREQEGSEENNGNKQWSVSLPFPLAFGIWLYGFYTPFSTQVKYLSYNSDHLTYNINYWWEF